MAYFAAETVTVASENMTVDLVVWRKFRRPMPGYIERVLESNHGLAESDIFLPVGTVINLPDVETSAVKKVEYVRLWQ